ncbi:MAG TPA: energy-coupling factor ABC transporter permease [Thiobacillaceae bacterium]|nr:energy-coupling factor ABC transporter permease [Thiobacillaceae bacterium]HNU63264.1 energy-coupling factor ABC transporter permease [Thiobacillaceae bacterium]
MHIPDGFISPQTYLPAYALCAGLWWMGMHRLRARLDEATLPYVAVLTALSFVLMMVALPLPGGTTAHAAGIALLAVSLGVWMAFLAVSMVLAMQALLFGDGGITALAVNALAMGFLGSLSARITWRLLRPLHEGAALWLAGWVSVVLPALAVALVLGLQPVIAQDAAGKPLFFPFGLRVTLPALLMPHALVGVGEGILTWLGYRYLTRLRQRHAT